MQDTVSAVRAFNRVYTQLVGALDARFLGTDLSLAEARLLFEIAHTTTPPLASDLQTSLDMDAGFLSRMLARFESRQWITRTPAEHDARQRPIRLTPQGHAAFTQIDQRQHQAVEQLLQNLSPQQHTDLAAAMGTIRSLLRPHPNQPFTLRPFRTGDMGMIAARQSILYNEAYGWGRGLEITEGETTTAFLKNFSPGREQCWVAELNGAMAGSVLLTDEGENRARLRQLYVEPMARGLGIGNALVETCLNFARQTGYTSLTLWTHTVLQSARRIYKAHGFMLIKTEMHTEFGPPVQGETWLVELA